VNQLARAKIALGFIVFCACWQGDGITAQTATAGFVVGVWRISEVMSPDKSTRNTAPQPGIIIFTRGYYSFNVVRSESPRPELPATGATDKQLADAFGPFDAVAGSYQVNGNQLKYARIAAKNPNGMRPGTTSTASFTRLADDTMLLMEDRPQSSTWKLSRIE